MQRIKLHALNISDVTEEPPDGAEDIGFDRSKVEHYQRKWHALVTRQLTFTSWLKSSSAVPFFQKLSKLLLRPMTLYIVEPQLMRRGALVETGRLTVMMTTPMVVSWHRWSSR